MDYKEVPERKSTIIDSVQIESIQEQVESKKDPNVEVGIKDSFNLFKTVEMEKQHEETVEVQEIEQKLISKPSDR